MKLLLICIAVVLIALAVKIVISYWYLFLISGVLAFIGYCLYIDRNEPKAQKKQNTQQPATIADMTVDHLADEIFTEQDYARFLAENELVRSFITKVVGVSFPNDNGTSRQEILSQCLRGEPVSFHWYTFRGDPACSVITNHGQIGHLPAKLAAQLDKEFGDDTYTFVGAISDILGGENDLHYGCNIIISIYKAK